MPGIQRDQEPSDPTVPEENTEMSEEFQLEEDEEDISLLFPELTRDDVLTCSFSSWYPTFRRVTFKSEIIKPLDNDFVDYLLSDGIVLPDNEATPQYHGNIEKIESDDGSNWSDEDEPEAVVNLDNTSTRIRQSIMSLGGDVFPRMNWSAPKDASWMATTNTLRCNNPSEIYVLLKSSDKISDDLENGRYISKDKIGEIEPELVLRQWCNLLPSMEFRCFVKNKQLVGISQIDLQYYEFLEEMRDEVTTKLITFFESEITPKFPSNSYCYDVYITRNMERVYVIDFEPWSPSVDSCLFEWKELIESNEQTMTTRLFPKNVSSLGHCSGKYSQNRFPIELTADAYQQSVSELIEKISNNSF